MKRCVTFCLSLLLLLALSASAAAGWFSAPLQSRAVVGADLTEEQLGAVYQLFGVQRGTVTELRLTNAEERLYLQSFVDPAVIGTRSISSVYVEQLASGSGLDITTHNVTWCSAQMYRNALTTAGVSDARVVVAAPFEVSGTAALAGVYKAYEDMTGARLDDAAKLAGTQELTVTGELAKELGFLDSSAIVNELKLILNETAAMSDAQLRERIRSIAARYRLTLTDSQVDRLAALCRSLEGLDADSLRSRVEGVQGTLEKLSDARDSAGGFFGGLSRAAEAVASFFAALGSLFG